MLNTVAGRPAGSASAAPAPQATPRAAVAAIIGAGRRMDRRGWVPATAGNISARLDAERIAITRSGCHKGYLDDGDVMQVDLAGRPLTPARPSAETLLHCQLYRLFPGVGAVLHGHSVAATVLSMRGGSAIRFSGYEIVKAFEGQTTHDAALDLPVFDNDQDIARLAGVVEPVVAAGAPPDMNVALARLEGLEFLLACELERRKLER
jgi:methylthioribulose-1-phosphate dehydratase